MNVLNKLAFKNLKLNKKRSIGTIIGIILSVALICAVAGLGSSLKETLVNNAIDETGYYHLETLDVTKDKVDQMKNNRDVKKILEIYHIGTSKYVYAKDQDNDYFDVYSMDKDNFDDLSYKLIDGNYPSNNNEIVVTQKLLINDNKKIGDTITLNVGHSSLFSDEISNTKTKTYKIVGIISKKSEYGYYGITVNEKSDYLNAYVILKNPKEYKDTLPKILNLKNFDDVDMRDLEVTGFDYIVNRELLRWETFAFSDSTITMLYAVIGVVMFIIVATSVFCIRNSFAISSQEKRKMYGMLSSVGTTKKQLKEAVLKEGFALGFIGIPLGVMFGILAVYILVIICNKILGGALLSSGLVFHISIIPILVAVILGFLTIYFSALGSAKKTSKISPIESLRGIDDIKIKESELKTPKLISKTFRTGGVIAYKNLKRSKRKYRTTVISLTVSILVFISMSSFLNESFKNVAKYYTDYDYNVIVGGVSDLEDADVNKLNRIVNIKNKYIVYEIRSSLKLENPKFDKSYIKNMIEVEGVTINTDSGEPAYISLLALDDATFRAYTKKIGKSYEELKNKGILFDEYNAMEGNKTTKERIYSYKAGDVIKATIDSNPLEIEIGIINGEKPYGLEKIYYTDGFIVVDKDYYNLKFSPKGFYIDSSDAEATVKDLQKTYEGKDITLSNMDDKVKEDKAMLLLVSIFLYGFIAVITLIGVTNIFNTITSNVELRAKEFATLKSIGMTKKEFKRMMNLETIFYSVKSLFYGIILGIIGSVLVHKAFSVKFATNYIIPYKAIIISIIAVFILVWFIMRYAINKVNKQNIMETIRNDNI